MCSEIRLNVITHIVIVIDVICVTVVHVGHAVVVLIVHVVHAAVMHLHAEVFKDVQLMDDAVEILESTQYITVLFVSDLVWCHVRSSKLELPGDPAPERLLFLDFTF